MDLTGRDSSTHPFTSTNLHRHMYLIYSQMDASKYLGMCWNKVPNLLGNDESLSISPFPPSKNKKTLGLVGSNESNLGSPRPPSRKPRTKFQGGQRTSPEPGPNLGSVCSLNPRHSSWYFWFPAVRVASFVASKRHNNNLETYRFTAGVLPFGCADSECHQDYVYVGIYIYIPRL